MALRSAVNFQGWDAVNQVAQDIQTDILFMSPQTSAPESWKRDDS